MMVEGSRKCSWRHGTDRLEALTSRHPCATGGGKLWTRYNSVRI